MDKMCALLKREGLINGFEIVNMSGKTRVQFPGGYKKTYGDKYELLKIAKNRHTILSRLRSHLLHIFTSYISHRFALKIRVQGDHLGCLKPLIDLHVSSGGYFNS